MILKTLNRFLIDKSNDNATEFNNNITTPAPNKNTTSVERDESEEVLSERSEDDSDEEMAHWTRQMVGKRRMPTYEREWTKVRDRMEREETSARAITSRNY